MIRLDWLNKYSLFTSHGKRDVRTPVHAWGAPRPHLIVQRTALNVVLTEADKSDKGFKMFLLVHHFLWAYPKYAKTLASAFSVCERLVQGDNLWRWVRMIAALKAIKIIWREEEYNNPHGRIFNISVDGTDFKVWEKKHPTMPIDKGQYSHKFNHGALK